MQLLHIMVWNEKYKHGADKVQNNIVHENKNDYLHFSHYVSIEFLSVPVHKIVLDA